jgi:ethanolamine utilization protein EutN
MIQARVIRPVWATKRVAAFPAGALLEVEELASTRRLVALDQLGAGPGDIVLVSVGSSVTNALPGNPPLDALVVGMVDELDSKTYPTTAPLNEGKNIK